MGCARCRGGAHRIEVKLGALASDTDAGARADADADAADDDAVDNTAGGEGVQPRAESRRVFATVRRVDDDSIELLLLARGDWLQNTLTGREGISDTLGKGQL